jgi:hypothetical protein
VGGGDGGDSRLESGEGIAKSIGSGVARSDRAAHARHLFPFLFFHFLFLVFSSNFLYISYVHNSLK